MYSSLKHRTTASISGRRCVSCRPRSGTALSARPILTRHQRHRSRIHSQPEKGTNEVQKLLTTLQNVVSESEIGDKSSLGWLEDAQNQGKALATEMENLRSSVHQKTTQLSTLKDRLSQLTNSLENAQQQQATAEAQLKTKKTEVDVLRKELTGLQERRNSEVGASMERYKELEDALAHVESELQTHSEIFQGKESGPVDISKLSEIVHEQDKVFQSLMTSLMTATESQHQAETEKDEVKRKTDETEIAKKRLEQDQELLSKELSQLQVLYAEKEIEWMNETQTIQAQFDTMKEETVGFETALAVKDNRLAALEEALKKTKSQLQKSEERAFQVRKDHVETKKENEKLVAEMKGTIQSPQHEDFASLQIKLSRYEVSQPVLEKEIKNFTERQKMLDAEYAAMEKEFRLNARKCAQLEQRATILQNSMEEKSNRLVAAHKERRNLKTEVSGLQRECNAFQQRLRSAYSDLEKYKRLTQGMKLEHQQMEQNFNREIANIAGRQQEAQNILLYHQEHKKENQALKSNITQLQQQLEDKKKAMNQFQEEKQEELMNLQEKLNLTKQEVTTKEAKIMEIQAKQSDLQAELESLRETSKAETDEKQCQIAELEVKVRDLEFLLKNGQASYNGLQNEVSKLQTELTQRQRIISARDQEVVTLRDDARLANERVEALRAQIASMQTLNREMEVEMAETDAVVSKMNDRLKEFQEEGDEKDQAINNLKVKLSDVETKSKKSMEEFTNQVGSLEEFSKQQEALVENFFEEQQTLEVTVSDLRKQIETQDEDKKQNEKLMVEMKAECQELKDQLSKSQEELISVKKSAADEISEAEKILAKAESVAQSAQGSILEDGMNGQTPPPLSEETAALQEMVAVLEKQLHDEQRLGANTQKEIQKLEMDVVSLREELKAVRDSKKEEKMQQSVNGTNVNVENELMAMSKRLSQSLAAEEAALSEIQKLRDRMKHLESLNQGTHHDEIVEEVRRRAKELELDNERLRKAADKRNQIIAQSKHFIQQYLNRSVGSLTDLQS